MRQLEVKKRRERLVWSIDVAVLVFLFSVALDSAELVHEEAEELYSDWPPRRAGSTYFPLAE